MLPEASPHQTKFQRQFRPKPPTRLWTLGDDTSFRVSTWHVTFLFVGPARCSIVQVYKYRGGTPIIRWSGHQT